MGRQYRGWLVGLLLEVFLLGRLLPPDTLAH